MSPEQNVAALIGRIDELTAQLEHGERLVFEQAARLGGIRRELETARKAVVELLMEAGIDKALDKEQGEPA